MGHLNESNFSIPRMSRFGGVDSSSVQSKQTPLFSDKEKACLEWTEAVTQLNGHAIADEIYERVRKHLSEKKMSDLTFAIGVINVFNRLNISFATPPGSMDQYLGLTKAGLK